MDNYLLWNYHFKNPRMDLHVCNPRQGVAKTAKSGVMSFNDTLDLTFRIRQERFMTARWKQRCYDCNSPLLRHTTDLWATLFVPSSEVYGDGIAYEGKIVQLILVNGAHVHGNLTQYSGKHRGDTYMPGSHRWGEPHIQ